MALLIGIVFLAVGVFFIWLSRRTKTTTSAASQWPTTPGRIIESRVVESDFRDPDTNRVERTRQAQIRYEYQVAGQTFQNDRVGLGTSVASPQAAVQQHPVGREIPVHYNPQKPADSALYVSKSQGCMFMIFGVLFLGFGLIATLLGIAMRGH